MQITLQIPDNVDLSKDVKELLTSLPEEKKHELALQLLERTLLNIDSQFMKNIAIDQALNDMNEMYRKENKTFYYGPSEEQLRYGGRSPEDDRSQLRIRGQTYCDASYTTKFKERLQHYAPSRGFFYEQIMKSMHERALKAVDEEIEKQGTLIDTIKETARELIAKAPDMAMNALTLLFFNGVKYSLEQASSAYFQNQQTEMGLQKLTEQLMGRR